MDKFNRLDGLVAPLDRANVDTDAIIPKQFLKSIKRSGFGPNAFDEWRYLDHGEPGMDNSKRPLNPDFVLNHPRYQGSSILLARENFGCGSSREHAPWALEDYGFRSIIAPSFADIFFNNCFKNGMLPIALSESEVAQISGRAHYAEGYTLTVDLENRQITDDAGLSIEFSIGEFQRYCLLEGLDDIGLTLRYEADIEAYETRKQIHRFQQITQITSLDSSVE